MRIAALIFTSLFALAACEREATPPPEPVEPVGVAASDELTGLSAAATGIDFWQHPNVAFNSLMIVASADGLKSYNIEDGGEVSSAPGMALQGVAVSYLGQGPQAAGVAVSFNAGESAFAFYGIDNVSRAFVPLATTLDIRRPVRGFCFGRGDDVDAPTLFVVQRAAIGVYNFKAAGDGLARAGDATIETPDDLVSCAIDNDGVLLAASDKGEIYRLTGEVSFNTPFAIANMDEPGGLSIIAATAPADSEPAAYGQIALLDKSIGAVHLFDRADGHVLGAVTIAATDEIAAVSTASVISATGANLGGLYRDGLIALGIEGEALSIRLIPINGVHNALSITPGVSINPRGQVVEEEDDGLLIDIKFQ